MRFHARLLEQTHAARQGLLATPIIQGALRGEVSLPSYLAFLREAYHHVRHTVPLLQATKAALSARHAWLRQPLDEYIAEEAGHDEWILDDIAACGGDAEATRHGCRGTPPRSWWRMRTTRSRASTRSASSAWCTCSKAPASRSPSSRPTPSRSRSRCPMRRSATCARTARSTASTSRTSRA
jgi:hypothetical protein